MLCRRCSIPPGASTLTDQHPPPPPAAPANRLRAVTWINTRTALGTCLVLTAILAGAVFLDRAQRLVPVYAGSCWAPAGRLLALGDLRLEGMDHLDCLICPDGRWLKPFQSALVDRYLLRFVDL
jgi:hypothetical protein